MNSKVVKMILLLVLFISLIGYFLLNQNKNKEDVRIKDDKNYEEMVLNNLFI